MEESAELESAMGPFSTAPRRRAEDIVGEIPVLHYSTKGSGLPNINTSLRDKCGLLFLSQNF